jgi:ethanolamine utilization protein EutJ
MALDLLPDDGSVSPRLDAASEAVAMSKRGVQAFLNDAAGRLRAPAADWKAPLSFGVDLGTATIVITAVDADRRPIYWDFLRCEAVRDGVVVKFMEAAAAVRTLKQDASQALGEDVPAAASAYPPGVAEAEARACRFVLENAGVTCRRLIDEVSAAQALLQVREGAIVDVGGGSTGVGVVENGRLVALSDKPGGGHHLDLILAGALHLPIEQAEKRKRAGGREVSSILRPGVERIANSIGKQIAPRMVEAIHLVGGAVRVLDAPEVISRYLGVATVGYPHSELVTPFGIAMS